MVNAGNILGCYKVCLLYISITNTDMQKRRQLTESFSELYTYDLPQISLSFDISHGNLINLKNTNVVDTHQIKLREIHYICVVFRLLYHSLNSYLTRYYSFLWLIVAVILFHYTEIFIWKELKKTNL